MEETQVTEQATTETTSPEKTVVTPEMNNAAMRNVAEMQAKAFPSIINAHLDRLMAIMVSTNGVSFQRKVQAAKAVKEALAFALDFGVGVTDAPIREKGAPLAKETNELAAVLVKAFDNRLLLLADNLRKSEESASEDFFTSGERTTSDDLLESALQNSPTEVVNENNP